ncbi:MAG: hypothetical protein JWM90_2128 [Thermoleophilia bacterium]|nr:hypothetical protein [Thermoleophilia bacterium]
MTFSLRRRTALATLCATALVALVCTASAAGALPSRTWVSGVGDDVNPCSRTAPCKTLAGAISKTEAGGEIDALDSGGFGSITITKSITLDGTGSLASILNALSSTGVLINGANIDVVLRNLSLNGADAAGGCDFGGLKGIRVLNARSVTLENVVINGNSVAGIEVAPAAGNVNVLLNDVEIRNNCAHGILVAPTVPATAKVFLKKTTISNSATALSVGAGGEAWVTDSTIFGNVLGLQTIDGGIINSSWGTNNVVGNTTNGTPTNVLDAPPVGLPGAAGAPGPAGPVRVVVASLKPSIASRTGARVVVPYLSTSSGMTTLTIRRGVKVVATTKAKAKLGRNAIAWNGKLGKKFAPAGTYKLLLSTTSADGQSGSASLIVKLSRPKTTKR